jgi:hypothetical protein
MESIRNQREQEIYELIYEINPNKINYQPSIQSRIIKSVAQWLQIDLNKKKGINWNDNQISRCVSILREYLRLPEFFPYFTSDTSEFESTELIKQLEKFYFLSALCESEPYRLKYVIYTTDRSYMKNKFDVLEDGKIHLAKGINLSTTSNWLDFPSDEKRLYDNYEEMKKNVCEKNLYFLSLRYSTPSIILKNYSLDSDKNVNPILMKNRFDWSRLFSQKGCLQLETKDGLVHFSLDMFSTWSNTFCNWFSDISMRNELVQDSEDTQSYIFSIPFSRKIFILYSLFRLIFVQKINIFPLHQLDQKITFLGLHFNFGNSELFFENYEQLYLIADYLEDDSMIQWVVRHFDQEVGIGNMYLRQKFLEILRM